MLQGMIAGNLGRDAELRSTQGGSVCSFSVATERKEKDQKVTTWVRCSLWGKRGEVLTQYLTKGTKVTAIGELSMREHEGKTSLNMRVSEVTLMGGGARGERNEPPAPRPGPANSGGNEDDQIPF